MRRSGLLGHVTEIEVHSRDEGGAGRLVGIALSQGGAVALRGRGVGDDVMRLTELREVGARRLGRPRPWWWTYRVRLAVREAAPAPAGK